MGLNFYYPVTPRIYRRALLYICVVLPGSFFYSLNQIWIVFILFLFFSILASCGTNWNYWFSEGHFFARLPTSRFFPKNFNYPVTPYIYRRALLYICVVLPGSFFSSLKKKTYPVTPYIYRRAFLYICVVLPGSFFLPSKKKLPGYTTHI
jgi:hypothetical protein